MGGGMCPAGAHGHAARTPRHIVVPVLLKVRGGWQTGVYGHAARTP
ncbi:unnamed protein product [Heterosigma akashiwo]